jgi:hypothetical protein
MTRFYLYPFFSNNCFVVVPVGRNRWLVRSLRTNNHTLPSHLRLCSLSVAYYDSQGLRWMYSNPPPHGSLKTKFLLIHMYNIQFVPHRKFISSPLQSQPGHWGPITIHYRLIWDCDPSHASYDSLGLRWRYSNPPPHGVGSAVHAAETNLWAYRLTVAVNYTATVSQDGTPTQWAQTVAVGLGWGAPWVCCTYGPGPTAGLAYRGSVQLSISP